MNRPFIIRILRGLRGVLLILLLAAALRVYRWSRSGAPGCYDFVETLVGRQVARIFRGDGDQPPAPKEDDAGEWPTPEEEETRRRMLEQLRADEPTHELLFEDGQVLTGRVIEERPQDVLFLRTYGEAAEVTARIPRRRLKAVRRLEHPRPEISRRDVRFQMEFPQLRFYRRPPFSLLTDESFFRVEAMVDILEGLHEQFLRTWRDFPLEML